MGNSGDAGQAATIITATARRDAELVRRHGFKGKIRRHPELRGFDGPSPPAAQPLPPSRRRGIMLKGLFKAGRERALVGLDALERCVDLLAGYELCVYVSDIAAQARAFASKNPFKVTVIPAGDRA